MTKTHGGKTYELVSEIIPARPEVNIPAHISCNCYDCVAVHDVSLCTAFGSHCVGKGVWKEVISNG